MYEKIKRLKDFDFNDKKVVMRVDFNVPFDKETREITSDKRIRAALPSINHILESGVEQLVLMSHFGKPKKFADKGKEFERQLSLDKVAEKLSELLGQDVPLVKDYMNNGVPKGKIVLLENVRFNYQQEQSKESSDREVFAKVLAQFGEIFINDAFGTCHRKQASVYDIAKLLPSGVGFLIDKEIHELSGLFTSPESPYVALLGGVKVEDKIEVIKSLSEKVDHIFIVGAMEYAFEKAKGLDVGDSLSEGVEVAKEALSSVYRDKLVLPVDSRIAREVQVDGKAAYEDIKVVDAGCVPIGYKGLDIGPKTVEKIKALCEDARTVFWNGPAGMFEVEDFAIGTKEVAAYLAKLNCKVVIGGGESVSAIEHLGLDGKDESNKPYFTHISTGGGAALEYLEKGHLPALDILEQVSK